MQAKERNIALYKVLGWRTPYLSNDIKKDAIKTVLYSTYKYTLRCQTILILSLLLTTL